MPISILNTVITTSIVVAVLIIYRQLDRNNRSLEKVKRYSDMVKKNLSDFVETKTTEIKDLSIELQVNLKTGKEILSRIKSMGDELREKQGDVLEVQNTVKTYDTVLSELTDMTAKVEENLRRIHAESGFVDSLGKKVKSSAAQMARIEKRIPSLVNEVNEVNRQRLESLVEGVEGDLERRIDALSEKTEDSEERLKDFSSYLARLEARKESLEAETVQNLEKVSESIVLKAQEAKARITSELESRLNVIFGEAEDRRTEMDEQTTEMLTSSQSRLEAIEREHLEKLNSFDADLADLEAGYKGRLETAAERGEALEHEAFQKVKESIEQNGRKLRSEMDKLFKEIRGDLDSGKKDLIELFGNTRSDVTVWQAEIAQKMREAEEKMSAHDQKMSEEMQSASDSLAEHHRQMQQQVAQTRGDVEALKESILAEIERMEVKTIEEIERKMQDYEGDALYRFGKLEKVNLDINELEASLREAMDRIGSRLKEDFGAFAKVLEDKRRTEKQRTDEVITNLRGDMDELEKGLAELKTKAYQDVSEKLKGFEDEFLADLSRRSKGMEESLQSWQNDVTAKVEEIEETHESRQRVIEKQYQEELKSRVDKLEQDTVSELSNVQEGLSEKLGRLEDELATGKQGLLDQLDLTEQEVSRWKERLEQEMSESKSVLGDRFSGFTEQYQSDLEKVRGEFADQRDELIVQTREERDGLRQELSDMSARVAELKQHLNEKTVGVFELFKKRQDEVEMEFDLKSRDIKGEIEEQVRSFKSLASDMKDKTKVLQDKLFGKVEDGYRQLSENLDKMEKQQRNFLSQTKLFERADRLKLDLERNIDELRKNMAILEPQRKDMKTIEVEYRNTKKLVEDVASKLSRFQADRRRVEDLEKNFGRLIGLSNTIEGKLTSITASNDSIEQIQIRLRDLESIEDEVEKKYERLEKKHEIIDTTTEGVEKNFQVLDTLERNIKEISDELRRYPEQLKDLGSQVSTLSKNKEKADSVVQKMEFLDDSLGEIEERIQKMQTAREWLAKTETRLEALSKQAQENVRLFQTLAKAEAGRHADSGAPTSDKREMVAKLAKLGWSSKEIAQRTNISRGEVELILELTPQRK